MQPNMQTTQLKGLFNSRRSYSRSFHVVPIVMKTLPTEYIWEQLPHLELGHSDASQDLRREEKMISWLLGTKKKKYKAGSSWKPAPPPLEITSQAGRNVNTPCRWWMGNVPLSLREEELNIQRSQQREKEVLVPGCLATGDLPENHHPSWLWDACWCWAPLLPLLLQSRLYLVKCHWFLAPQKQAVC